MSYFVFVFLSFLFLDGLFVLCLFCLLLSFCPFCLFAFLPFSVPNRNTGKCSGMSVIPPRRFSVPKRKHSKKIVEALTGEPSWELPYMFSGGPNWELQANVLRGLRRFGNN